MLANAFKELIVLARIAITDIWVAVLARGETFTVQLETARVTTVTSLASRLGRGCSL